MTSKTEREMALGDRDRVIERVQKVLIEGLRVAPELIDAESPLFGTGLGLDSVDAVELVVSLEMEFDLSIPEDVAGPRSFRTVGSVADLVMALAGGREPAWRGEAGQGDGSPLARQMRALRHSTALFVDERPRVVIVRGERGFAALDRLLPTDLFLRDGAARQSLVLDARARPQADVLVGRREDDHILFAYGADDDTWRLMLDALRADGAELEERGLESALVAIHGPYAWELLGEALGPDLVPLPYLGVAAVDLPSRREALCVRAGRTGEYGYELVVPHADVDALVGRILDVGAAFDIHRIGTEALRIAAIENWFFDAEAVRGLDVTPIELQLSWRLSPHKPFGGRDALAERAEGGRARLTPLTSSAAIARSDAATFAGREVGRVIRAAFSPLAGQWVGEALVEREHAQPGRALDIGGARALTVAPPLLDNVSLRVDPRRHTYRERAR